MADHPKSVTSVTVKASNGTDEPETTVQIGASVEFSALVTHLDETTSVLKDSTVTWKSSDTGKASFEGNKLTGKDAGPTNVTATVDGIESAPIAVTVTDAG